MDALSHSTGLLVLQSWCWPSGLLTAIRWPFCQTASQIFGLAYKYSRRLAFPASEDCDCKTSSSDASSLCRDGQPKKTTPRLIELIADARQRASRPYR